MQAAYIDRLIGEMSGAIGIMPKSQRINDPVMIGIQTGGAGWLTGCTGNSNRWRNIKEPLINPGRADMRSRITECKAQIAGNSQTIAKICNAAIGDFGLIDADLELIRGSLKYQQ